MDNNSKGLDLLKLANAEENNKIIGLVQSSCNILQTEYLSFIINAKELCDYLVVVINNNKINNDEEKSNYNKIMEIADDVVYEEKWETVKRLRPDIFFAREFDYTKLELINLEEYCNELVVLPLKAKSLKRKIKDGD